MKRLCPILVLLAACLLCPAYAVAIPMDSGSVDYTETTDIIYNPERGFYRICRIIGKDSGTEVHYNAPTAKDPSYRFQHVRIGLGNFSLNYLKATDQIEDADYTEDGYIKLSDDFLETLNAAFAKMREQKVTVILRIAYDNFDGTADCEPSLEGIKSHLDQLKPFFYANADVIAGIETGILGPWGEQHGSALFDDDAKRKTYLSELLKKYLEVTPDTLGLSFRRPLWVAEAAGISLDELTSLSWDKSSPYYRVGCFNDGYLGTDSDRGTFVDRASEVAWVGRQSSHVLYGGEVVDVSAELPAVSADIGFISKEMFVTKTSYLNYEWSDNRVQVVWKQQVYEGDDEVYQGVDAYTYIANHLGYRFVLTSSSYENAGLKPGSISFSVKNVGAGNLVKEKAVKVSLKNKATGEVYSIDTSIDPEQWLAGETVSQTVSIPADVPEGTYEVFVDVADSLNQIQFANKNSFGELGNSIGTMSLSQAYASVASAVYTGKALCPAVSARFGGAAVPPTSVSVTYSNNVHAGTGYAHVKFLSDSGETLGACSVPFKIAKKTQHIQLSKSVKKVKRKALKKKKRIFSLKAKADTKVSFKSLSRRVKVSSKGKVTVLKGTKAGKYKIKVSACGTLDVKQATRVFCIVVK